MRRPASRPRAGSRERRTRRTPIWLALLLVGLVRVLAPFAPMADASPLSPELAALLGDGAAICGLSGHGQAPDRHGPAHHDECCLLCPACHLMGPAIVPEPVALPLARAGWARSAQPVLPPARGPPVRQVGPAQPRAPPVRSV